MQNICHFFNNNFHFRKRKEKVPNPLVPTHLIYSITLPYSGHDKLCEILNY